MTKWLEDVRYLFSLSRTSDYCQGREVEKHFWPSARKFVRILAHPWPNCIYKICFPFSAKYFPNIANTYILIAKENSCDLSENSKHVHLRSTWNIRTSATRSLMLIYTNKARVKKFGSVWNRRINTQRQESRFLREIRLWPCGKERWSTIRTNRNTFQYTHVDFVIISYITVQLFLLNSDY